MFDHVSDAIKQLGPHFTDGLGKLANGLKAYTGAAEGRGLYLACGRLVHWPSTAGLTFQIEN